MGGYNFATRICFKPQITGRSVYLLDLFSHYQNHVLWVSGGIANQPAAYVEAMQYIEQLTIEKLDE